eukprot:1855549-Amphidinium_carterae.1
MLALLECGVPYLNTSKSSKARSESFANAKQISNDLSCHFKVCGARIWGPTFLRLQAKEGVQGWIGSQKDLLYKTPRS